MSSSSYPQKYTIAALRSVRGNVPQLTDLCVAVLPDDDVAESLAHGWNMFELAPKMVSFQCINCDPTLFLVPWSQLISIPYISLPLDQCIEILRDSPFLEEVTVSGIAAIADSHPPVRHDHLKRLTIEGDYLDFRHFYCFFAQVALESLETLEIRVSYGSMSSALFIFLSKFSTLRCLSLGGAVFEDNGVIIKVLENTPFLSDFTLSVASFGGCAELFAQLGTMHLEGEHEEFDLLPKLEILSIETPNRDIDMEAFIELVKVRAATLQDVTVEVRQPDARLCAQLENMESETLSITICPL